MKLTELTEGVVKRGGELSTYRRNPAIQSASTPARAGWNTRIRNLAARSGKTADEVQAMYHEIRGTLDMRAPGAYAALMAKLERALGLRESINEDAEEQFKHISNKDGELTYGWKTDLEAEEFKGYIPKGYSKRVLELGGIYAKTPGGGQGDKLMKLFLSSPEAQAAELIFLDPVPGLGANFRSKLSDEEQIRRLQAFYRRYGFRNNPRAYRMWLVKKGSIPDNKLPT